MHGDEPRTGESQEIHDAIPMNLEGTNCQCDGIDLGVGQHNEKIACGIKNASNHNTIDRPVTPAVAVKSCKYFMPVRAGER